MDKLNGKSIINKINGEQKNRIKVDVRRSVTSTNTLLKQIALKGEDEMYFLLSDSQTEGRGRLGRTFFSPETTGLYMSLLLRPDISPLSSMLITTAAAVAVSRSLEKNGCENLKIKWVNDILKNGKKICGILTESSFSSSGSLDFCVLGVGINMYEPKNGFPDDIKDIASFAFEKECDDLKNSVAADFINEFCIFYENLEKRAFLQEYKKRSEVPGKSVDVIRNGERRKARVLDIDENCHLLVEYENNERETLSSGEVSIRNIRK